jgi:N6-adenosine-specific RNA methylase IME4
MGTEVTLIHYDAARAALAKAVRIDEVKQVRDMAVAAQVYAQQAQDYDMINNATEIRERAERRAGEILIEMRYRGERRPQGGDQKSKLRGVTLKSELTDLGINKIQSSRWQAKAAMSEEKFEEHLERTKRRVAAAGSGTTEEKQQRRASRIEELAEATAAAATTIHKSLYNVILADPPWRFEPYSRDTGMDRAADNHYPTMTLKTIKALPVPAAEDCVLFLWATAPMLLEALDLMRAWGFDYKSNFVWIKDRVGTGYWNRNRHELLLVGTRGDIPAPAPGDQYDSVIEAPRRKHSVKPFAVHEMIEEMFPSLPKLEMFARESFDGWDSWGNEVEVE